MLSPRPGRYISIQVQLAADHPGLLEGLDEWLKLGLIAEREVRDLCQRQLSCAISVPEVSLTLEAAVATPVSEAVVPQLVHPTSTEFSQPAPIAAPKPSWVNQFLTRLINEVSVIWLLCLGVFLVVVSSAVLAASQWQQVSAAGQYSILLAYTIAFIVAGFWLGQRPQLQLTAEMLKITSLLIIPVNFWMMDGFKLLYSPTGIGLALIAAIGLSGAILALLPKTDATLAQRLAVVGLSWLHWGWGWPGVPLWATYAGCIGTSLVLLNPQQRSPAIAPAAGQTTAGTRRIQSIHIVLPFGVLLLLFRAGVMAAVPIAQLGLAIGLCGWLLSWLARDRPTSALWHWLGGGLLLCGGLASVNAEPPWQALLVSGLGLWLIGYYFRRDRQPLALVGLVGVALIAGTLVVRMVPSEVRGAMLSAIVGMVGSQGMPEALYGLNLYPYLLGMGGVVSWLQRQERPSPPNLAWTAYSLTGLLGAGAIGFSIANPVLRSLLLWLMWFPSAWALRRSGQPIAIYGIHLLGLAAVCSTLDNVAPYLTVQQWGIAALVGMTLEWLALLLLARFSTWQQSTWYVGMGWATLGYLLLLTATGLGERGAGGTALAIPIMLGVLPFFTQFRWPEQALGLSIASMIAVQVLTFETVEVRLAGLALSALLMLLNTVRRPNVLIAALSVGFGLTFGYATSWEVLSRQDFHPWVMLSAVSIASLFGLRHLVNLRDWPIRAPVQFALDGWASLLTFWVSLPLLLYCLWVTEDFTQGRLPQLWMYPAASFLMLTALLYRYWQAPAPGWLLGIAGLVEVSLVCTLKYALGQSLQTVAIATLALGLAIVLGSEVWVRRTGQPYHWSGHIIPLGYGLFGWLLGHTDWSASTGLYTLALAGIALGVGRRRPALLPVTILGLLAISAGAFELLLYPLLQAEVGQPGEGCVALAGLALALALTYRVLERWGPRILNLPPHALSILGDFHWGLGTLFLLFALPLGLSATSERVWSAELLLLGGYALFQGRRQSAWTYAGLVELYAAVGHILYTTVPGATLLPWASAITSTLSLVLYSLPWARWGWSKQPFLQVGLVVPAVVTLLTADRVNISSLLLSGSFYGWMAFFAQTPRLGYIALFFANGAALKLLDVLQLTGRIWVASLIGLSLLFIVQMEPALRSPSRRNIRHLLRCFAAGLIAVTVLYESDTYFWPGLLAIVLSLGLIGLGLFLRVRAFLYVGTLAFLARVLRMIWLFVTEESLVLWALGIALGLLLIWIAATFEARRSQMTTLLQYWVTALEEWQ
jgi:hypothetical protein